ncbi:MAG: dicarboxylate/amino acid:cation symporter [Candidatus Zixiibacteriota bacterium]
MRGKISNLVLLGMLVGVLLGGLLGYFVPSVMLATSFVGRLFLNALRIIMVPLLITSLIAGISALGGTRRIGRMAAVTISYYVAISIVAALIGLAAVGLISPGEGMNASSAQIPAGLPAPEVRTLTDFFATLIPDNPILAIVQGHLFGHVLLALFVGGILVTLGPRGRTAIHFFHELREALFRLVTLLLKVAPIGLLSLVGTIVAQNPESVAGAGGNLAMYTVTMVVGLLLYAGVALPLILKFAGKRPPFEYLSNMVPALATAFATSSPAATLPVTYQCVTEKNRVDQRAGGLALPFGAMVNMGATSLYLVVATMFIAQAFAVDLGAGQVLLVVVSSILLSMTATGLPSAAFLTVAGVLAIADFPPAAFAGLGLILLVDWIIDRFRVKAGVWGDAVGAAIVARVVEQQGQRPGETFSPRGEGFRQDRPRQMDRPMGRPQEREPFRRDRQFGGRPGDRGPRRDSERRDRPPERRRDFDRRSPFAVSDKSSPVIEGEHVEAVMMEPPTEPRRTEEPSRGQDRPHRDDRHGRRDRRPPRGRRDHRDSGYPRHVSEPESTEQRDLPVPAPLPEPEPAAELTSESIGLGSDERTETWPRTEEAEDTEVSRHTTDRSDEEAGTAGSGSDVHNAEVDDAEVTYGRTRARRFERTRSDSAGNESTAEPSQSAVTPDTPEPTTPDEPIEFGRTRRKRFR